MRLINAPTDPANGTILQCGEMVLIFSGNRWIARRNGETACLTEDERQSDQWTIVEP